MSLTFKEFSKMEWLDDELENHKRSVALYGKNEKSDAYYKALKEIRDAQNDGTISDDIYPKLCIKRKFKKYFSCITYCYYLANIHYDCFYSYESIESIEKRMLYFLKTADKNEFYNLHLVSSFFCLDDFLIILRKKYSSFSFENMDRERQLDAIFPFLSELEKSIVVTYKNIISSF